MSKPIYQSKTFWTAVIAAAVTVFEPRVQDLIKEYPQWAGSAVSFVFLILRLLTTQPVRLRGKQ